MDYFIDFLKQFTWIDIFVVAFFIRVNYISLANGIGAEFFKFLGTVTGLYLALHYYSSTTEYVSTRVEAALPATVVEITLFILLFLAGYLFFAFFRMLLKRFMSTEVVPTVSRWGGLIVGSFRGLLLISVILYGMLIPRDAYIYKSIARSFSGMALVYVAPSSYQWMWETLISKFSSKQKFNKVVFEIEHQKTPNNPKQPEKKKP
jgi:uncharacterized membrane protein required for colicin V production